MAAFAAAGTVVPAIALHSSAAQKPACPPVVVFSKIYQELNLNYDDAAELTAEAGLEGIDCPVRPGGEVLPERVADDLPRYAEALRKCGRQIPLLTTSILGLASPHTEEILRTAKQLGTEYYRLGFVYRNQKTPVSDQIRELRAQLKDLAALNQQFRLCALLQNHSPAGKSVYLAGDISEMRQILDGFDPRQVGAAFDIGHALIVHGDGWRSQFEALKAHFKIAYIKDSSKTGRWTPFGQGDIGRTDYFKLLKQSGYRAPFSLHIEYDWSGGGKAKNRARLVAALKESSAVLRRWFTEA